MGFRHLAVTMGYDTRSFAWMAMAFVFFFFFFFFSCTATGFKDGGGRLCAPEIPIAPTPLPPLDVDLLQFALNLEHLEADYFINSALGLSLDDVAPELVMGGPPPIGARKANLDRQTRAVITEFGFEEVGHLRAIKTTVGGFPRPLLDLSAKNFARIFDQALGYPLNPPFDPYANSINYLLASYVIPYMGLVGYVGANPLISGYVSKRLLAGLLGVEAGQDAVIRTMLYERAALIVHPYNRTVAEFTAAVSELRNRLAGCGIKDEGIIVPPELGAEGRTSTNVLSADRNSLSYTRSPEEILRVVYGTGDERRPGGFFLQAPEEISLYVTSVFLDGEMVVYPGVINNEVVTGFTRKIMKSKCLQNGGWGGDVVHVG